MKIQAVKEISIKEHGEVRTLQPGIIIDLEEAKAKRLLDAGVAAPAPLPDYMLTMKTKTGRDIYLVTSERLRKLVPKDKPVFGPDEIFAMRGLPDEQIEAIITTKETFPGAIVEQSSLEREEVRR